MTYQEAQALIPKKIWDKVHDNIKKQQKESYEDKVESLENMYFCHPGDFINWSMTWSETPEGHEHWEAVCEFFKN